MRAVNRPARRPLLAVAATALAVLAAAGCGSSSNSAKSAATTTTAGSAASAAGSSGAASTTAAGGSGASTTAAGGAVNTSVSGTVNWWGWTPTNTATANTYIAAFNKLYPKVKINFKLVSITDWVAALRPALASGSGVDIFDMQPGAYVTEFGSYAEDATPLAVKALGSDWQSKVAPIGISGLTSNGKLTALSVGSTFAGTLWINKNLFDKYGLTPPTNLTEWIHDCQAFKSHNQGCFVQGASQEGFDQDTLQSIANSVQPGLWTKASKGEAKWNDPGIVKTLTIWKQLFTSGIMQSGAIGYQQYPDANNDFLTGKYAMVMMGTWYMQNATQTGMSTAQSAAGVANATPFPIVPIAFPDVAGAGNKSELYGDSDFGLAIDKDSKNKAAAEAFATWLTTSTAGQQLVANQLDDLPALRSVQPDFNQIKLVDPAVQLTDIQSLVTQVGSVSEPREALLGTDVQNAILAAATSVASGSSSPQSAANTLQSAAVAAGETFK
jgi:raffinose/stachyose/melibiose transport system substrate-binding protein